MKAKTRQMAARLWGGLCLSCAVLACGPDKDTSVPALDAGSDGSTEDGGTQPDSGPPQSAYELAPQTLREWRLFADETKQEPGSNTLPYEVISPLFSDYTAKHRFIYLPAGAKIGYAPEDMWDLPEGSILIKTFAYPHDMRAPEKGERLLETRLLVFTKEGVKPHTYVWNEEQTNAVRKVAGTSIQTTWIDAQGKQVENRYSVPNTNQCLDCHGEREATDALGLRTRQFDRSHRYEVGERNQIDHMTELGLFDREPEPASERERLVDPMSDAASLSMRARSYLDVNCAQCHKQGGDASASGMWLDFPNTAPEVNPAVWGVCKRPTSAGGATCGREVDIVPGQPDQSIYMCRVESSEPKVQMPPLGRNLVHTEGVELLRAWIESLEGECK